MSELKQYEAVVTYFDGHDGNIFAEHVFVDVIAENPIAAARDVSKIFPANYHAVEPSILIHSIMEIPEA